MTGFDCNCFVGNYPFHKVRKNKFEDILELHRKNGIGGGCVSSLEAIFYNDPWEADAELHEILKGYENYHHVITVNPMLPGCLDSIHRAVKLWGIRGVRILPGFHGYSLEDEMMGAFCDVLRQYDLTLFLTQRIEDERNTYFFHPKTVSFVEIMTFLHTHRRLKVILCGGWNTDIAYWNPLFNDESEVYWECSAMRGGLYIIDDLYNAGLTDRLLYGSMAPIFVLKSSCLLVETADVPDEVKERILSCSAIKEKGWFA